LIYNKQGDVLWPKVPEAVCEATNSGLKKYSPEAVKFLSEREDNIRDEEPEDAKIKNLPWQYGPTTIQLSNVANLTLPDDYRFLSVDYASSLNQREIIFANSSKNEDRKIIGFISPKNGWWRATLWLDKHPTINFLSLKNMNTDNLLRVINSHFKEQTASMETLEWSVTPEWNDQTHRLSWSVNPSFNESKPLLKSIKLGSSWLIQMMLTNSEDNTRYPQHTNPAYIVGELNKLQESIKFDKPQEYSLTSGTSGVDATQLITGSPTKQDIAFQRYFEREHQQQQERKDKAISDVFLRIIPLLLLALLGGGIATSKKRKKASENTYKK